jgi:diguanylate cyclase (GGDEF)-like protein
VDAEVLDISSEMVAHETVRARERLLQRLAESLPDGVLQIDADRTVVYANSRAQHLLGANATLTGLVERTVAEDRPMLLAAIGAALGSGEDRDVEVRVRPPTADARDTGDDEDAGSGTGAPATVEAAVYEVTLRAVTDEAAPTEGTDQDDAGGTGLPRHRAISGALCCIADVTEQTRRRHDLEVRATYDELTAAYNRAATLQALDSALVGAGADSGVAVVFVDLDGFKQVNDQHGHAAGDQLLHTVAARLRHAVRAVDVVGRLGGDEFLVVCPGLGDASTARDVVDRITRSLADPAAIGDVTLIPKASLGVAWTFDPGTDADTLIAEADASMYEAKRTRSLTGG